MVLCKTRYCFLDIYLHKKLLYTFNHGNNNTTHHGKTSEKNTAAFTHLSTLSQYIIPFGNYIFPLIIWTNYKDRSEFADHHGKQALNFQLSLLLYTLILALIAIPIFVSVILQNIPLEAVFNDHDFVIRNFDFQSHIGMLSVGITSVVLLDY